MRDIQMPLPSDSGRTHHPKVGQLLEDRAAHRSARPPPYNPAGSRRNKEEMLIRWRDGRGDGAHEGVSRQQAEPQSWTAWSCGGATGSLDVHSNSGPYAASDVKDLMASLGRGIRGVDKAKRLC